jgi:anti-sigma regulatory factor (Ser/Thr protein kinase)
MSASGSVVVELTNDARSAGVARQQLRHLLGDHPRIDDVLLCASEVVTNAVVHAGTLSHITVDCEDDLVRVEVVDGSPQSLPEARDPAPSSPSGRGMRLVAALADRWGVEVERSQKCVWFEFDAPD